jgi:hypothetical protein
MDIMMPAGFTITGITGIYAKAASGGSKMTFKKKILMKR